MAPKAPKAPKPQPKSPDPPEEYPTIAAKLQAEYLASRPFQVLKDKKGLSNLSPSEKAAYANYRFLETGVWKTWPAAQQKEFWKAVETQKIPTPRPPCPNLGRDNRGREIGSYSPGEFAQYRKKERDLDNLRTESERFRKRRNEARSTQKLSDIDDSEEGLHDEINRRKLLGVLQGKKMGIYEGNPTWDDVLPIPQDDGEGALAAIAYADEYSEAMGYLRAVMAAKEHSPRVLKLTEHIITMNPAHYTVWLYRASTLFALRSPLDQELIWVNDMALDNQKNYQIWHHRQLLIDTLYPTIASNPTALQTLEDTERSFMTQMFDQDAKNYHVWSYRQYLVRKLNLFNAAELQSIEALLRADIRNNSAWSHRFYVVFSDPGYCTPGSKATAHDPQIPAHIVDRELAFAQAATFEAPQNQSPWNYIRGVLRKAGRELSSLEAFAGEFVTLPGGEDGGGEDVKSSHALDFLADVWSEKGEVQKADRALRLLGDKYDRVRRNYWEWRRGLLKNGVGDKIATLSVGGS